MTKGKKKKSYNPFEMWGSWIGLVIAMGFDIIRIYFTIIRETGIASKVTYVFFPIIPVYNFLVNLWESALNILPLILIAIYGFLIGWGIHSLVRVLRK